MLKFGTPTIALPLAIKKCTVQTGCTVYALYTRKMVPIKGLAFSFFFVHAKALAYRK